MFESLSSHSAVGAWESLLSHFWVTLVLSVFLYRVRSTPTSQSQAQKVKSADFRVMGGKVILLFLC